MNQALLRAIQHHIAVASIPSSALRNQGTIGVTAAARQYLATVPLRSFSTGRHKSFTIELDRTTEELRGALPIGAQAWGTARKAMNLFLRDCYYNKFLHESFGLGDAEAFYEIPLDGEVAKKLVTVVPKPRLSLWRGVKHLTRSQSVEYQEFARVLAASKGVARVHLDAFLWPAIRR